MPSFHPLQTFSANVYSEEEKVVTDGVGQMTPAASATASAGAAGGQTCKDSKICADLVKGGNFLEIQS